LRSDLLRDPFAGRPTLRRVVPWLAWVGAVVVVFTQVDVLTSSGLSPAVAEARVATLSAQRAARVERVEKRVGDVVNAGDVIAVLGSESLLAELAVARADLLAMQSEVRAKSVDVREADREVLTDLGQGVERAAVDVARYQSDLDAAKGELSAVTELLTRQQALVQKGLATTADTESLVVKQRPLEERVRTSQALVDAARAHEQQARARLVAFTSERKRDPKAKDTDIEARVAPAEATAQAQAARVAALDAAVSALTVRAPAKGVVNAVYVEAGSDVDAGAAVAAVVKDGDVDVVVYVDERTARRVKVGTPVALVPSDLASAEVRGTVRALAPVIGELPERFRPVPTQPAFGRAVVVDVDAAAAAVLPGMAFDARFVP
jgi:multidrug resistance efflux pump